MKKEGQTVHEIKFYCKICDKKYYKEKEAHKQERKNLVPLGKVPFGKGPPGATSFACKYCVDRIACTYNNGNRGVTVDQLFKAFKEPKISTCPW